MARGNPISLLQYVTAYLRLCQQSKCECDSLDNPTCGFDHYPCGYYFTPSPDVNTDQPVPKSRKQYYCYCPRVLPDGERLLTLVIAQHGGDLYYKLDNIAEIVGRSHRQLTRLVKSLERKAIAKQYTCKQVHCDDHHRSRHIRLSLQLPGMPAFEEMERQYMNLARQRTEGR